MMYTNPTMFIRTITIQIYILIGVFILVGWGCNNNNNNNSRQSAAAEPDVMGATFVSKEAGYSVRYLITMKPLDAAVENADLALEFEQKYFIGTNLQEGAIRIAARTGEYIAKCVLHPISGQPLTETTVINGVTFYRFDMEDAGAGQRYYYRGYRTLRSDICYALDLNLHSTNPEISEPSQLQEFKKQELVEIFDALAQSFTFF